MVMKGLKLQIITYNAIILNYNLDSLPAKVNTIYVLDPIIFLALSQLIGMWNRVTNFFEFV